ncbi:Transcriptional regulator, LysR family [hydrothermal vent metagenome]|uniref:Transcriptional regulator, LysR family n=1 Tax=hydrothermal vent metagenome TaxID=652676 RepID=A0A3B0XG95_9ZZZZ
MDLNAVELFVRVVQKGSFSAASRSTGVPVATVSRKVSELEQSLGARLLERSTRHQRLTGAGSTLYEFASRGLEEMDAGALALQNREAELRGTLRLSLPPDFEPWWKLLNDFQKKHPDIALDIYATERKVDLIEDGIDVALRIGDITYPSAIARKIISYQHILVATPQFVKTLGSPETPQDLPNFPCAAWCKKDASVEWMLGDKKISIVPFIKANDYPHMRYLALQDLCITEQPPFMVNNLIAEKHLLQILPEYDFPQYNINLLYKSRKQLSRIARAYIDFCISNARKYLTDGLHGSDQMIIRAE